MVPGANHAWWQWIEVRWLNTLSALRAFWTLATTVTSFALLRQVHEERSRRVMAEAALHESEERFRVLFEHSPDALLLIDPQPSDMSWPIVACNEAACRMNGYKREELIGKSIDILHAGPVDLRARVVYLERMRREGTLSIEATHQHKDGRLFIIESSTTLVTLAGQQLVLGVDRDITEKKQASAALQALTEQLTYQAHHDPLTGLPNRRVFEERLKDAIAHAQATGSCVAVCFIDVDHFKAVNDTFGHAVGDDLLRQIGARLEQGLRTSDMVSRISGDEFTIILADLKEKSQVMHTAQRLVELFQPPFTCLGENLQVTASIGVSLYPDNGATPQQLLSTADGSLYQAKQEGKNTFRLMGVGVGAPCSPSPVDNLLE